jgi:hypothetical protein
MKIELSEIALTPVRGQSRLSLRLDGFAANGRHISISCELSFASFANLMSAWREVQVEQNIPIRPIRRSSGKPRLTVVRDDDN